MYLDVQRSVVDAGSECTHDGTRFFLESTTKGGFDRRIGLSASMTGKLFGHLDEHRLGDEDLVFPYSHLLAEWTRLHPPLFGPCSWRFPTTCRRPWLRTVAPTRTGRPALTTRPAVGVQGVAGPRATWLANSRTVDIVKIEEGLGIAP